MPRTSANRSRSSPGCISRIERRLWLTTVWRSSRIRRPNERENGAESRARRSSGRLCRRGSHGRCWRYAPSNDPGAILYPDRSYHDRADAGYLLRPVLAIHGGCPCQCRRHGGDLQGAHQAHLAEARQGAGSLQHQNGGPELRPLTEEEAEEVHRVTQAVKDKLGELQAGANVTASALIMILAANAAYGEVFYDQKVETTVDKIGKSIQLIASMMLAQNRGVLDSLKEDNDRVGVPDEVFKSIH